MPDYSKPFKSLGYTHYLNGWQIRHKTGGKHKVYDPKGNVVAEFDDAKSAMKFLIGKVGK
jgi:hypothetical protein